MSASFVPSGLVCPYHADGELQSCEEVSEAGAAHPLAEENCEMIGSTLRRDECPTEGRLGQCDTTEGAAERGTYALRINYYLSNHMPDTTIPMHACEALGGRFTAL